MRKQNSPSDKYRIIREFQSIPGVGKSISKDLYTMGFRSLKDIKNKNPEKIYNDFVKSVGKPVDKCMLYVLRGAVYYASNPTHDPELLLWWNWKGRN